MRINQSGTWKSNQEETHQHNREHGSPIKKRHISTIENMEVQSRRDTSAQSGTWKSNQEETHQHTTALRANYVFIFATILAPPLPPFPMSWGKSFGPNMGFHCKNHEWNGLKWNEMMCFGSF